MPAYTTRAAVETKVPPAFVIEACDDDNDGTEDAGVFDGIVTAVGTEIDGYLEARIALPLSTVPAKVATAALYLVCESLYARRGYSGGEFAGDSGPKNPWSRAAATHRKILEAIGNGEQPLTAETPKATEQITVISEPAKTTHKEGKLLA
jgi:hypothetical protein